MHMQVKLLKVLQDKKVMRVGSVKPIDRCKNYWHYRIETADRKRSVSNLIYIIIECFQYILPAKREKRISSC